MIPFGDRASNWLYHLIRGLRPMWGLFWRFRVEGAVEAIPRRGPLILVANHASFLDPWFLCVLFPRDIYWLITRNWYYKTRAWERFFAAQGCIPVMESADETMETICGVLERGGLVGVFPEGRISRNGKMERFRTGVCYMAARSGAPVLPVGIVGAYETLPRERRFPRPGPLTIRVGEPLVFPGAPTDGQPTMREVVRFRNVLASRVAELSGQPEPVTRTANDARERLPAAES